MTRGDLGMITSELDDLGRSETATFAEVGREDVRETPRSLFTLSIIFIAVDLEDGGIS